MGRLRSGRWREGLRRSGLAARLLLGAAGMDRPSPLAAADATLAADRPHGDATIWIYRVPDEAVLGRARDLLAAAGGAAIAGEVWAVPTAAIGGLLAEVPRPLGFGRVMLESDPCLGFLAEAEGVAGAADNTHHGGWRAYLATSEPLAAFIQAGAALLGVPIDPAWQEGVAFHLRTILAQAAMVGAVADVTDPAPVFRA